MNSIVVTGANGKAGQAVVADLIAHGYAVTATDVAPAPADLGTPLLRADLADFGQAVEVLHGAEAVVHLANIPAPGIHTPSVTLNANLAMNGNVFLAAAQLRLRRVVWASSETTLGLPFDPPRYVPVDEAHFPYPSSTYALSKVLSETMAAHISDWSGIPFVGLRFSNIFRPDEYARVPGYWADPHERKWNAWGYIDARDVAAACRNALEAETTGAHNVIIAAADTIMNRPSRELMADVFPDTEIRRELGEFETLLAIDRARELIGFAPAHSWRNHVAGEAATGA
jgi:nucleoside-diphosphate-sugar epimerase